MPSEGYSPSVTSSTGDSLSPGPSILPDCIPPSVQRQFSCVICYSSFETASKLEQHARGENHRTYVCTDASCGRSYCRRDLYTRHMRTHKQPRSYECMLCRGEDQPKGFKRKDHLQQHIRNCHPYVGRRAREMEPNPQRQSSSTSSSCSCACRGKASARPGTVSSIEERLGSALSDVVGSNRIEVKDLLLEMKRQHSEQGQVLQQLEQRLDSR